MAVGSRFYIKRSFKCEECDIKEDDITELTDLTKARGLLIHHRIPSERVETVDKACELLQKHLQDKIRLEPYDTEEVSKVVRKLVQANTQGRLHLLSKLKQVQEYISSIPPKLMDDVKRQLPEIQDDLRSIHEQLEKDNCTLMIAGETGAGKSCLLNLLLGEITSELLAVNNLPATSALCEIKYGDKKLKAYPFNEEAGGPVEIQMENNTAADIIGEYTSKKGERTDLKYNRVEVFWPVEWIKHGITITDTPGVGESEQLTQLVKDYIPKAAGFIYVINTPNAGGINPEELEELLFYHISREGIPDDPDLPIGKVQEKIKFNPRSAIFVCNKWDQVPAKEQDEIKGYVKTKLQKVWKDFDFDNQVFFISAKQIQQDLQNGYVSKEYRRLLAGIQNLLPIGFRNKMEKLFWKMYHIMERTTWVLKNYILFDDKEERQQKKLRYRNAKEKLLELKKRPEKARQQMKQILNDEVNNALTKIREHMKSKEVQERLITWNETECPDNDNWKRLLTLQNAFAQRRIKQEIHKFEEDHGIFENIQKKLMEKFQSIFVSVEGELANIENDMKDEQELTSLLTTFYSLGLNEAKKLQHQTSIFKGSDSSKTVFAPLGVVINAFALPVVSLLNLRKQSKQAKQIKEYRKDKPAVMAQITQEVAAELLDSRKLRDVIEGKLSLLRNKFTKLLDRIPLLIDANKELLSTLEKELELASDCDFKKYVPLLDEGVRLQQKMNFVYMCNVRSYNIDLGHIKDMRKIGEGAFANVYKGRYERKGTRQFVAVKRFKEQLTEENVTLFLNEELNLRPVQSPYVVRYIGTAIRKSGSLIFPAMVQEYCALTFDGLLYKKINYNGPGSVPESDGKREGYMQRAARYIHEISLGLAAMHKQGFVHRDLKPENILLTLKNCEHDGLQSAFSYHNLELLCNEMAPLGSLEYCETTIHISCELDTRGNMDRIKLCDLGISKREKDIMKTVAGTPMFMAPEIHNEENYDRSADMFSFGLMMWEIWYGSMIEEMYTIHNYKYFCQKPFRDFEPPQKWKNIMTRCWAEDRTVRPTAEEVAEFFSTQYASEC